MLRPPALRVLSLAALLVPAGASAQAGRDGLSLSATVYAAQLSVDDGSDESSDSGGGIGVEVAYGFTPRLAAFLALGGAAMEPEDGGEGYGLGTADLGLRFNLRPSSRLNPYLQAAVTGQVASFDVPGTSADLEARGGGLTLGGGLLYDLSPSVAFDVALDVTGGRFTELAFDGESTDNFDEIDSAIVRLGVGLVVKP